MTTLAPRPPGARGTRPRRGRRLASTVAAVAVAALVAGCGSGSTAGEAGGGPVAAGFPRTVEHAMGSSEIPNAPQRVAALDSSFVDATLALETPVVAYTRYPAGGVDVPAYLTPEDRRFLEGARVTGTLEAPDVEALYEVAPDVIVSAKVRQEQYYDQLSDVAPTVFSETTGPTWKDNIRLVARTLGKEDLAERKIAAYEARARAIGDAVRARLGRNPTYSLVRFNAGDPTVRLGTSASFPGIVMTDLGFARPPGQPDNTSRIAVNVPQEQITQLDADRILISTYTDPRSQAQNARAQFEANPLWGTLRGQRIEVDDTSWYTSVSLQGAARILDDVAASYGVDPARG